MFVAVPPLYKVELSLLAVAAAKALSTPTSSITYDDPPEGHPSGGVVPDGAGGAPGTASEPPAAVSSSDMKAAAASKPKAQPSDSGVAHRTLWCFSEGEMREAVKGLPSGSFTLQVC